MTKLEKMLKDLGTLIDYWDDVDRFEEHIYGANILNTLTDARTWIEDTLKERQWVSVKDRLPENNTPVNAVWINHDPVSYYESIKDKPFVDTVVYNNGVWYWWNATIVDYLENYGSMPDYAIDKSIEITHWMPMPLPEPPKEDKDDDE